MRYSPPLAESEGVTIIASAAELGRWTTEIEEGYRNGYSKGV
jgi:hypothetical protein